MEVKSIEAIVRALKAAQVNYLIVGGLAVNAHGFERMTRDLDLVIQLEPENIKRALHALIAIGYQLLIPISPEEFSVAENRQAWREDKGMIVLKLWSDHHRRTPIDIFVYEPFDFVEELKHAKWLKVFGEIEIPVISLATLYAMKEEAGRDKDLIDIRALHKLDSYR